MKITHVQIKRDPDFLRLASDLRFEAKRAAAGEAVDEVKGIPTGKAYGSRHEERLRTDAAYRDAYATALIDTADAAEARGELGAAETPDEPPPRGGVAVVIRDPQTGEAVSVRRVVEDTPLGRARYTSDEPISDLQWLAGTMFEADSSGEVHYRGNAEIIAANGDFRIQAAGIESASAPTGEIFDGEKSISHDPSAAVESSAWRLAKVARDLTPAEQRAARLWLVRHVEPASPIVFKTLLDKLVSLYSTHDDGFAFYAWRHTFDPFPHLSEAANDNDASKASRRSNRS